MKDVKNRNSNFELLRIVSMFFIVIYHIILNGALIPHTQNSSVKVFMFILELIVIVHVSSFVLITGYFQSKKDFKMSKVWSLINASWFYRVVIMIILMAFDLVVFSKLEIIKETSILTISYLWFVRVYLALYCFSPFLNKFINSLSKKQYLKMLIVSFIFLTVLPYISGNRIIENHNWSIVNMIFLYFIGAYLRIYPIKESYLFKRCSKQLLQVIFISIFFICVIINFSSCVVLYSIKDFNSVFNEMFDDVVFSIGDFVYNPFITIQAIAYFCFFETLDIKSKVINKISSLTFGVYLIHENFNLYPFIYSITNIYDVEVHSFSYFIYIFIVAVGIFASCAIIEWLRQVLFKFIKKRKLSVKLRNGFNNWIRNIKIIDCT